MKRFTLVCVFLTVFSVGFSENPQQLFQQASDLYANKKYEAAVKMYEKILQEGFESPSLYFNLGNAYYKQNNIPNSIWYYEKAKKLAPGDEDINFNLRLANTKIVDKIESVPELFIYRWWKNIRGWYAPDGWARISIVLLTIFFLFTAMYLLMKKIIIRKVSFWIACLLLLSTSLTFTFAYQTWKYRNNQKEAIIFSPAVNIKSSPDDNSVDIFVLHEGTKVVITDNLGDWYKILIANGSVGWLKADAMKII
ncbi:MAG: tetratricopeptide repeat protein [Bacteroidales bacterium]